MKKFVVDAADYVIEALYKNMKEMEARTNGKIQNVQKDLDDWKGHTTEEFIKVNNRIDKIVLQ
jgi:hypothetical protein